MYKSQFKHSLLSTQATSRRERQKVVKRSVVSAQRRSPLFNPRPKIARAQISLPQLNFSFSWLVVLAALLIGVAAVVLDVTSSASKTAVKYLTIRNPILFALVAIALALISKIKAIQPPDPVSPTARSMRLSLVGGAVAIAALGVVARLIVLQAGEQDRWADLSSRQYSASVELEGARGDIVDGQGRLLATSVPAVSIGVHPRQIANKEAVANLFARELGLSEESVREQLNKDTAFVWLARGLPKHAQATVESLKSRAINAYPSFRRFYPQGTLASPIIGRISREGKGQSGVERIFDHNLGAEAVNRSVRRDAKGRLLDSHQSEGSIVQVSQRLEGDAVKLTIDSFVQNIMEEEVVKGQVDAKAKDIFAVVMDAESGAILGMAQTKGFDPNSVSGVTPEQLKNMVAEYSFEPGSTMKPLVAAYALQQGIVRADQQMDCEASGRYKIGRHTVRDAHPVGKVDMAGVIIKSSNICMAKIAQKMGGAPLHSYLASLGFGNRTGLELPGEASGILRPYSDWKEIDVATHSFGQGIAATAIQMVRGYGVLANGGYLVEPTLLSDHAANQTRKQILTTESTVQMSEMLRRVVADQEGTGKKAAIPGLTVYGKTGTAQKANPNGRGYLPDAVFASFIGFVKGQEIGLNRSLVMLVAVDEPGVKPRWGGVVAAPVFQKAMERIVAYLLTIDSDTRTASAVAVKPERAKV